MSNFFDRCGMTVAGLCGVHCVALVVVSLIQPLLAWGAEDITWLRPLEITFAGLAAALAIVAFASGYRHHGHLRPVLLGAVGLGLIWLTAFTQLHDRPFAVALTILGGACLIVGHRWNIRCRCGHGAIANKAPEGAP